MSGHLRVRDVARKIGTERRRRQERINSTLRLTAAFSALMVEADIDDVDPADHADFAGRLLVAVAAWCGHRGIDPQDCFEEAWFDYQESRKA